MRHRIINNHICFIVIIMLLMGCSANNKTTNMYNEYYRQYNKVRSLEEEGKIKESLALFEKISNSVNYVHSTHYYDMARVASRVSNCKLAEHYFTKALENGYEYGKILEIKKRMKEDSFKENYGFDNCRKNIRRITENHQLIQGQYLNGQYKKIIEELIQQDKNYRGAENLENLAKIDSMNINKLLELIKTNGYPSDKQVGHKTSYNAYVLMLHFDRDHNNKILKPILDEAYKNGYLGPTGLAWIVDRRRETKKVDPYYYFLSSESYKDLPLEKRKIVDYRRDSIGLEPIELK